MSIYQQEEEEEEETTCSIFLDELYCEEETWEVNNDGSSFLLPITSLSDRSDSLRSEEEQELENLFKKEKQGNNNIISNDVSMMNERKENIEWMLKVKSNYGFCGLTIILSVNYFDRFISSSNNNNNNNNNNKNKKQVLKPWTIQLAAVTCLSLAAKVEETFVPSLLDLQVEGGRQIFEGRDVEKMELLVLSALEWKMHPITPFSFLHHFITRLGFNYHLHCQFLTKCEHLLLSLLSDWRFVGYQPSVMAAATMMHVIDQIHNISNPNHYQSHLLNLLNLTKEKVNDCYEKIVEKSSSIHNFKRKLEEIANNNNNNNNNNNSNSPSSPSGVIDAYGFSSDSSNDSWVATGTSNDHIGR